MSNKTKKIALAIILAAGILGIGYIWLAYGSKPDRNEAPDVSQKASNKILLNGTIVADRTADLGFINPAAITSIDVKVGDAVRSGQVLATQNAADLKAQADAAQAQVGAARSHLDSLGHDLKQDKLKLHGLSGNSKKEQKQQVSSSEDSVDEQKSNLAAAQDTAAAAMAQLAKSVLRAPFDGIIIRQDAQTGEISGYTSAPFITLASNGPLTKVEAFASDIDVNAIKAGEKASVSFDAADGSTKTVMATVSSVDPATTAQQGTHTYKVTLLLDAPLDGGRLGMHASVSF